MMYIAIALTLLALVAGIHLMWRSKTDAMGNFSKWVAYGVIIISIGMLLCELARTSLRIIRHEGYEGMHKHHMGMMQYCPPEMCGGVPCMVPMGRGGMDCCGMGMGNGDGKMDCCKGEMGNKKGMGMGKDKCCDEMEEHGDAGHMHGDTMKMGH